MFSHYRLDKGFLMDAHLDRRYAYATTRVKIGDHVRHTSCRAPTSIAQLDSHLHSYERLLAYYGQIATAERRADELLAEVEHLGKDRANQHASGKASSYHLVDLGLPSRDPIVAGRSKRLVLYCEQSCLAPS